MIDSSFYVSPTSWNQIHARQQMRINYDRAFAELSKAVARLHDLENTKSTERSSLQEAAEHCRWAENVYRFRRNLLAERMRDDHLASLSAKADLPHR